MTVLIDNENDNPKQPLVKNYGFASDLKVVKLPLLHFDEHQSHNRKSSAMSVDYCGKSVGRSWQIVVVGNE